MKKLGVFLLALLMLAGPLVSCSEGASNETESEPANETEEGTADTTPSSEEGETDPVESETKRADIPDNLPEMNFGDSDFRAAQQEGNRYEFYSEEMVGESTNDAVYNRNLIIEQRFGVHIVSVDYANLSAITQDVDKLVKSGTDAYEVACHGAYMSYVPISNGDYRNWNDVPYVDFSQPWWNHLANEQNTVNGILYTATGDINITSLLYTYGIFVNADLAQDYGIHLEDLYQLVYEGEWTIDKMIELTSTVYRDENGNSERDEDDTYGYAAWPGISADAWLAAFDQPISTKGEDGFPEVAFLTDKTISAIEKISAFYYETEGAYADGSKAEYEVQMFVNNHAVMVPSIFNDAFTTYRFMEASYAILPYPKWDTAQAQYLTNARDQYTVLGIPLFKKDSDLEKIGVVTEALAAESYRSVFPQYYDIALKGRYSLDPDTANMVDRILAGRNFDFAFLFGQKEFQNLPYMFRNMLHDRSTDIASEYAKLKKALTRSVKKIAEYYTPEEE